MSGGQAGRRRSIPTAPARGIPGPGGWGAILISGAHRKELSGGEAGTTNNRMELIAAISALEALKAPSRVELHTDSKYVQNGIGEWIHGWKKNGWKTAAKTAGQERRAVAAARRRPHAPRGRLALGQGRPLPRGHATHDQPLIVSRLAGRQ